MAPFSLSLRSKRSRGARPRTPSSPASFATPRSPPWFVAPSWPQQRLFMDINTPQGEKTLILPHEENSAAATSPPQPAEQEKIQAIAVPRPSTTTGVRRPSLSSVAPPSPTHRRAESQGLSSNVHASVRRGPPRPLQIRSTPDLSISPNRKASRFKGEAGRFDTKELPPVPDRKGQSNFPEGPSVAEPRDTSQPDKPVLPDRSNSTIARQISGNREKKSSQKPRSEVPGGMFFSGPHGDFGHERSATEATIIPTLPRPNGSEVVDHFTSPPQHTPRSESLPTLLGPTMEGPSTIPVAPGLQSQTASSLTNDLPPVELTSRSGTSAGLPSKADTNLGLGAITGVPPPSPGPGTNESGTYQPYQPQGGDLLFSPNFILADEGGHTPGLFPEDYSIRTSSQFVSELSQEDAEFLSATHAALDLRPRLIAETMARQDSATLPAEGDGSPRLDSLDPPLGDSPGEDHRKSIFRHPHEVQFHPKPPNASGELFPSIFAAGAVGNARNSPPEILWSRSHRLDKNDVDGQSLGARFPRQRSLKRQGSLPSSTEGAPIHGRSSTLSSLDRFRRIVSAALVTASISRSTNTSSDIASVGGSTSPSGNRNTPDRLLDSARRFVSGSGSFKSQALHQQPPDRHQPYSHDHPGDVKGKGKADTSASISGVVAAISGLDPDRRGCVQGSSNSSPNSAFPSHNPVITHTLSESQSHEQGLSQQPQQLGQSPASATSSNTTNTPSSHSPLAPFSRPTPHSSTFTLPSSADDSSPLRFAGGSKVPLSSFDHLSGSDHLGPRVRSASEGSTILGSSSTFTSTTALHDTAQYQHPRLDMKNSTESLRNPARTLTSVSLSDLNFRYNSSEIGADSAPLLPGTPFPSKVRSKRSHPTILRVAPTNVPPASSPQPDTVTLQTQTPSTVGAASGSSPHFDKSPGVMLPQEPGESLVSATSSPGSIANSGRGLRPVTPTPRLHFEPSHPIGSRTRPVPLPIIRAGSYDIKHPTIIDSSSQKKISQSSDPIVPQLSAISPFPPNLSRASPVAHPYVHLQNRERPSSFSEANRTPSSPIFDTVPIQWKGLTMEQAKWTFSKAELQSLAASAIRQSAEATSIRLLHQRVVDVELPEEIERLETQRDEIKAKYQHQARLRKLLMRSLALYIDGSDTDAAFRLLAEIAEVSVACETLSTDLFVVMDQLAQISRLRDTHMSSALTMALHKLNAAFLRTSAETEDLRETVSLIEADRDEGWAKAFELEHTLDAVRRQLVEVAVDKSTTVPPRGTRVSAARKSSLSKASFRSSSRRSARLSSHNMKMVNLVFPHPPSAFHHDVPAPILPLDANKLPTPVNRLRPESVISRVTSTGVSTPSSTRAMVNAQNEVLELLGLSLIDLDKSPSPANSQRPRPHSLYIPPPDIVVPAPDSPRPTRPASLQVPSSPYSLHTLSPYLRRSSTSILDGSTSSLPHPVISLTPGDPDAIFRAMVSRAGP